MAGEQTIHIVNDDAWFPNTLELLLRAAGCETVQYGTLPDLLDAAPGLSGGCALLAVRRPEIEGLTILEQLQVLCLRMPVIIITGHVDNPTAILALKAGAVDDFVERPFGDERLVTAIEDALVSSERDMKVEEAAKNVATLSRRERQVLDGLVAGHHSKTIAADLGISARTVDVHRTRMLERLGTSRPAVAIRLAALASLASGFIP